MASRFEQLIRLRMEKYSPEEAKKRHIAIARDGIARRLGREQGPPMIALKVDGRAALSEEEVRPYGLIVYRLTRMREIARFALGEAERLSPVASGRYRRSWFVMMGGRQIGLDGVPNNAAEVIVVNDQPYHRKLVTRGATRLGVPPGIVERVRQAVLARYRSTVEANIVFMRLDGGYVLKTNGRLQRAKQNRRSSAFRGGREFLAAPKDRRAGEQLTYPAVLIEPRR